eukprot:c15032_g1_i1.p1 GENE.c15032_g1_i1~~c15032_g1_i1.p1  ORF type:complete len:560 (-),score=174.83 c15032_g1_i1:65-1744(-)
MSEQQKQQEQQTIDDQPYLDIVCHKRKVKTSSPQAQTWFDRGFANLFGFNHEEAIYCFKKSLEYDPNCYMAAWGVSFANGVNYNSANTQINALEAFEFAKIAYEHRNSVSDVEKMLFEAIHVRYAWPMPENESDRNTKQNELNAIFALEMEKVYNAYPDDPDVVTFYLESLLDLAPWKLWIKDENGNYPESTLFVEKLLEESIKKFPNHPGLLHFYIHCEELSPSPQKALAAADILRTLVPDGGHLLHMPSHIDMWLGHYENAIESNRRGVIADEKFIALTGKRHNFYFGYRIHNYHFLTWACMVDGQYKLAKETAEEMRKQLTREAVELYPDFFEGFTTILFHVLIRFGKWEEILEIHIPDDQNFWCAQTVVYHYSRGLAFSALGKIDEALKEEHLFKEAMKVPSLATRRIHNNFFLPKEGGIPGMLQVAEKMLRGEIEYRRGNFESAFEQLQEAVKADDSLLYDEPWGWMQPTRHALGALLLEQHRTEEATLVFQKDLQSYPENMWSLYGLCGCLKKENKMEEYKEVLSRFQNASKRSEISLNAACFCANRPLTFKK